jgi:SAM-dependent methyltransferase
MPGGRGNLTNSSFLTPGAALMSFGRSSAAIMDDPIRARKWPPHPHAQTRATATIQEDATLLLRFDLAPDDHPAQRLIDIRLDGAHYATLPAMRQPGAEHTWQLNCSLPAQPGSYDVEVEGYDPIDLKKLFAASVTNVRPLTNGQGILASDVFDPAMNALFSAPWLAFDGAILTVSGAHLPPFGDPALLDVEFAEGVHGTFEYPLPSPDFGAHYWYWPNAHMSGFRVRINLATSVAGSNAFTFRFVTRAAAEARPSVAEYSHGADLWEDRARLWIPSDLRAFMGQPSDGSQMSRVQTWSNHATVSFTGYNAFKGFESLAARYGLSSHAGLQVLDWGCGHGRLTRHFIDNWHESTATGADIDAENINWCKKNLHGGHFTQAPLWPPLNVPACSYDLIIGLSVMTHLTAKAQEAWLKEINRLLKPGGLAFISFGGNASAAFSSLHQNREWWNHWRETGFDDNLLDPVLDGKIGDDSYYRVTHQSPGQARQSWSRVMTIEEIVPQAFGYQDVAVLRAR